jgi:chemotaxis protein CheD
MIQEVAQEQSITISLGEMHVSDDPSALLVCFGIGSCIAFTGYDPGTRISGMAHFVLPDSTAGNKGRVPERFVDLGIPLMVDRMERKGALKSRITFKIAGGAHMVVAKGFESKLNIGERNIEAAKAQMAALALRIRGEDVGGTHGRTVRMWVRSGKVTVTTVGGPSYEL